MQELIDVKMPAKTMPVCPVQVEGCPDVASKGTVEITQELAVGAPPQNPKDLRDSKGRIQRRAPHCYPSFSRVPQRQYGMQDLTGTAAPAWLNMDPFIGTKDLDNFRPQFVCGVCLKYVPHFLEGLALGR